MKNNNLQGCSVVVTRPAEQAQGLVDQIESAGGHAVLFPVLKITETDDKTALDKLLQELSAYSILIFISPNAVKYGLGYLLQHRQIPTQCKIATVGAASATSAAQLLQRDIDIVPASFDGQSGGYNSEALLALTELQSIKNQKIAILRGNGGRELLATTLRERGAQVSYINTYKRSIPDDENCTARLDRLLIEANNTNALCVTITSGESLHNFLHLLGHHAEQWRQTIQLIVINQRLVSIANQLGFKKQALVADNATNQALTNCALQWHQTINSNS